MNERLIMAIASVRSIIESDPESFMEGWYRGGKIALDNPDMDIVEVVDRHAPVTPDTDWESPEYKSKDRVHFLGLACAAVAIQGNNHKVTVRK